MGLNVGRLEVNKRQLLLWDLGGQPGLRSIWDKYYADCHGVVFVVDSTSSARWELLRDQWLSPNCTSLDFLETAASYLLLEPASRVGGSKREREREMDGRGGGGCNRAFETK